MQQTPHAYERAFEFRQATRQGYRQRIDQVWPEISPEVKTLSVNNLPFTPIDVQQENIPELISRCRIDHSVSPVADTRGGSVAGYQRWNLFLQKGIRKYAKGRNDPLRQAVSRMSAYLHYGMVSPMRLARDANAVNAEKYLDELLIWRELAYHFCFHRHNVERLSALPHWAQETLKEHARDPRSEIYSWEELARGRTGDEVWDAAQASLLKHGELHNNIRMTWGKALLNWTASPQKALSMLIDLNHRFALDGRDPASYGGILWCFGQFDRPFQPERPVHGLVRGRTTAEHRKRLDFEAYRLERTQPNWRQRYRVAVIGAGMSGMAAARTLTDQGVEVEVFEKSRGLGGRMSTRRVDGKPGFDHGAQYFTARNPIFKRYVNSWIEQGLVQTWSGTIGSFDDGTWTPSVGSTERFVGVPSMNSICKHLGQETHVHKQTRVDRVENTHQGLSVVDDQEESYGPYDWVVVSA
ncbi:MAG: NAD(P)-binding protein, partial [Pirellulaceae bacterium]|nr:NAD(P)-binding protein [Pirellulaceae bacterium]